MTDSDGYFPTDRSVLRRVHAERAVGLVYGQRALIVGGTDPRTYIGFARHTDDPFAPFTRLAHTGKVFEAVFFGDRDEADRELARVHALHRPVRGRLPEDAGPHPAGTPYAASDPELALWTVAVAAESAITVYETLVGPLAPVELEALWQDYVRFGELFGLAREHMPAGYGAFRAYWDERMAGDLHVTRGARLSGLNLARRIPLPPYLRPALGLINLFVVGTLPERVRELYGLPWRVADEATLRSAAATVRALLAALPEPLRRGRNSWFYDAVTRSEQRLLRDGKATWCMAPA